MEKVSAHFDHLEAQCVHQVLNDVLSFNRMAKGTFTLSRAPFDFHKSIQFTVTSHEPTATAKDLQMSVILDPNIDKLGCLFLGDERRLRQITR